MEQRIVYHVLSTVASQQKTCALRAPTLFCVRIKTIRTQNKVMVKSDKGLELFFYQTADCVRTRFRPCAIGDPRGRIFVRATSQPYNNGGAI
jgi:hypothetical protein